MIGSMPTSARPQQRYDHRLRHLVQRTGDVTVATDLGVPRSTARGWLGGGPTGGSEAAPTRPEAHGAAPTRAGPVTNVRVSPHRSASAGRTRQDRDPASR